MKIRHTGREDKIELQMTPMIDIVFQLLVFFIMTFKIILPEGDFNILMPLAPSSQGRPEDEPLPPMTIMLTADTAGHLVEIRMNDRSLGTDFAALRSYVITIVGGATGPDRRTELAEVELDFDDHLRYQYVIEAITAVTGTIDPQTGKIIKLIEKIHFAPPPQ